MTQDLTFTCYQCGQDYLQARTHNCAEPPLHGSQQLPVISRITHRGRQATLTEFRDRPYSAGELRVLFYLSDQHHMTGGIVRGTDVETLIELLRPALQAAVQALQDTP